MRPNTRARGTRHWEIARRAHGNLARPRARRRDPNGTRSTPMTTWIPSPESTAAASKHFPRATRPNLSAHGSKAAKRIKTSPSTSRGEDAARGADAVA